MAAVLFWSATACVAADLKLESGSTLTITKTAYGRTLPHAFYDQAMESLPLLYPRHVLLAGRRFGTLGDVVYSLICFKKAQSSQQVEIEAIAVYKTQAWNLEASVPLLYGNSLVQVLEEIAKLPANPAVRNAPASRRR